MCEFAVTFVEHKVLTNRSLDMAERAIQMFCSYLPESVAEKCEQFVDDYGDQLVKWVVVIFSHKLLFPQLPNHFLQADHRGGTEPRGGLQRASGLSPQQRREDVWYELMKETLGILGVLHT